MKGMGWLAPLEQRASAAAPLAAHAVSDDEKEQEVFKSTQRI